MSRVIVHDFDRMLIDRVGKEVYMFGKNKFIMLSKWNEMRLNYFVKQRRIFDNRKHRVWQAICATQEHSVTLSVLVQNHVMQGIVLIRLPWLPQSLYNALRYQPITGFLQRVAKNKHTKRCGFPDNALWTSHNISQRIANIHNALQQYLYNALRRLYNALWVWKCSYLIGC